jgi:hypothetical protein
MRELLTPVDCSSSRKVLCDKAPVLTMALSQMLAPDVRRDDERHRDPRRA